MRIFQALKIIIKLGLGQISNAVPATVVAHCNPFGRFILNSGNKQRRALILCNISIHLIAKDWEHKMFYHQVKRLSRQVPHLRMTSEHQALLQDRCMGNKLLTNSTIGHCGGLIGTIHNVDSYKLIYLPPSNSSARLLSFQFSDRLIIFYNWNNLA